MTTIHIDYDGTTYLVTVSVPNESMLSYIWPYLAPEITTHCFDRYSDILTFIGALDCRTECIMTDLATKRRRVEEQQQQTDEQDVQASMPETADLTGRFKVGGRYDRQDSNNRHSSDVTAMKKRRRPQQRRRRRRLRQQQQQRSQPQPPQQPQRPGTA